MKKTFIEFLKEWDRGDWQLQKQHAQQQADKAERFRQRDDFKSKMAASSPSKGDIVVVQGNQFRVLGGTMKGTIISPIGGDGTHVLPHGTKFQHAGVNPKTGQSIFKLA